MANGAEVGQGHVAIFPTMNGFRQTVAKEMQASGKSGSSVFSRVFDGTGRKIGKTLGTDTRKSFEQASEGMSDKTFKQLTSDAANAARQLSKAREQARSSSDQVRVAEQRLAEAIAKNGAESSQAISAQNSLAAAERKSATASENLVTAQQQLAKARKAVFDVAVANGDTGLEWLKANTERAAASMELARKKLAEADDSVAKAEQRLSDAIAKSGEDSKQAVSAQARLMAAKTRQAEASDRLKSAERELAQAQDKQAEATKRVEDEMAAAKSASGIFAKAIETVGGAVDTAKSKIGEFAGSFKGLATGLGIGAAFGKAIESGIEQTDLHGTLKAAVGNEEEARQLGNVIGRIYADGWGSGLDEIKEAAQAAKQTLRDVNETDLETVTRNAITLSDVFGSDVNENVRGVNALMEGFGLSATEATDLLTAGMQHGLNYSDELADNLSEYAGRWGEAGMSASEYFSLLQAGADNGAYQLDKVGDFLNEALTSLTDGRVYEILGLLSDDTAELFTSFQNGGAKAGDVLQSIIKDLNENANAADRAMIMSELWGSLGEDNAQKMILAMGDVKNVYDDVAGAAQQAAEDNQSVEATWSKFTRKVSTLVGSELIPVIEKASDMVDQHGDDISRTIGNIAGIVGDVVSAFLSLPSPVQTALVSVGLFGGKIGGIISVVKNVSDVLNGFSGEGGALSKIPSLFGKIAGNAPKAVGAFGSLAGGASKAIGSIGGLVGALATNPWVLGAAAIGLVVGALVLFFTKTETGRKLWGQFTDFLSDSWRNVVDFFTETGENLTRFFTETLPDVIQGVGEWFQNLPDAIGEAFTGMVDAAGQWFQNLPDAIGEAFTGMVDAAGEWASDFAQKAMDAGQQFLQNLIGFIGKLPETIAYWLSYSITFVLAWIVLMAAKGLEAGMQFLTNVGRFLSELPGRIGEFLQTAITTVIEWVANMASNAVQAGQQFLTNVGQFFQQLPGNVANFLQTVITAVTEWVSQMASNAARAGQQFLTNVGQFFQQLPGNVANFLRSTIANVGSWVSQMATNARNAGQQFLTNVGQFIQQLPGRISGFLTSTINGARDFAAKMGQAALNAGKQFLNNLLNTLRSIPGQVVSIGSQIVQGIVNGITGSIGRIGSALSAGFHDAIADVKRRLGIQSPSKVFRDQVGKWIPAGVEAGIDKGMPALRASLKRNMNGLTDMGGSLFSPGFEGWNGIERSAASSLRSTVRGMRSIPTKTPETTRSTVTTTGQPSSQQLEDAVYSAMSRALAGLPELQVYRTTRQLAMAIAPNVDSELAKRRERGIR